MGTGSERRSRYDDEGEGGYLSEIKKNDDVIYAWGLKFDGGYLWCSKGTQYTRACTKYCTIKYIS